MDWDSSTPLFSISTHAWQTQPKTSAAPPQTQKSPPGAGSGKKGSAAVPGRSTNSVMCSNKGSNPFDCCGLLGLPEIVWRVCGVCVPMETPWWKVPGLCWAGVCECSSEYSSLSSCCAAAAFGEREIEPEEFRRYLCYFWKRKGIRIWNESWRQD